MRPILWLNGEIIDPGSILHKDHHEDIKRISAEIMDKGWKVPKWMIDKCRAELHSIR